MPKEVAAVKCTTELFVFNDVLLVAEVAHHRYKFHREIHELTVAALGDLATRVLGGACARLLASVAVCVAAAARHARRRERGRAYPDSCLPLHRAAVRAARAACAMCVRMCVSACVRRAHPSGA